MVEHPADHRRHPSVRALLRDGWNTLHTVYYANSVSWRALKSGALFFFGFFLWAGSNVVYSYQTGWTFLHYAMAYGLLLIVYGPVHHLVVIPLSIRWRRAGGRRTRVGRHLPNGGLALFLIAVVLLGTFPVAPVQADLSSSFDDAGPDISPDLLCTKHTAEDGTATIHCHLTEAQGIDRVVVASDQRRLAVDDDPPFDFTISSADLSETRAGQQRFRVDLLDADGDLLRRYTRTVSMVPEGE